MQEILESVKFVIKKLLEADNQLVFNIYFVHNYLFKLSANCNFSRNLLKEIKIELEESFSNDIKVDLCKIYNELRLDLQSFYENRQIKNCCKFILVDNFIEIYSDQWTSLNSLSNFINEHNLNIDIDSVIKIKEEKLKEIQEFDNFILKHTKDVK